MWKQLKVTRFVSFTIWKVGGEEAWSQSRKIRYKSRGNDHYDEDDDDVCLITLCAVRNMKDEGGREREKSFWSSHPSTHRERRWGFVAVVNQQRFLVTLLTFITWCWLLSLFSSSASLLLLFKKGKWVEMSTFWNRKQWCWMNFYFFSSPFIIVINMVVLLTRMDLLQWQQFIPFSFFNSISLSLYFSLSSTNKLLFNSLESVLIDRKNYSPLCLLYVFPVISLLLFSSSVMRETLLCLRRVSFSSLLKEIIGFLSFSLKQIDFWITVTDSWKCISCTTSSSSSCWFWLWWTELTWTSERPSIRSPKLTLTFEFFLPFLQDERVTDADWEELLKVSWIETSF